MKKPNFWLYLAGEAAFTAVALVAGWLGIKYDNPAAFYLAGAYTVFLSNLSYEYMSAKMAYWRTMRDQEVQHEG